uniref:Uncharacterized protein n=1 Tax=viral metagenome TaxID=1070528 RepID=A0A6M3XEX3_9ZZZZ
MLGFLAIIGGLYILGELFGGESYIIKDDEDYLPCVDIDEPIIIKPRLENYH